MINWRAQLWIMTSAKKDVKKLKQCRKLLLPMNNCDLQLSFFCAKWKLEVAMNSQGCECNYLKSTASNCDECKKDIKQSQWCITFILCMTDIVLWLNNFLCEIQIRSCNEIAGMWMWLTEDHSFKLKQVQKNTLSNHSNAWNSFCTWPIVSCNWITVCAKQKLEVSMNS